MLIKVYILTALKRSHIFSNLFDSQRVDTCTSIINEGTGAAVLCCHEKK